MLPSTLFNLLMVSTVIHTMTNNHHTIWEVPITLLLPTSEKVFNPNLNLAMLTPSMTRAALTIWEERTTLLSRQHPRRLWEEPVTLP